MQQLMQEFYTKKDKKPRVPKFGTNPNPKKKKSRDPTMPTFTVEEMMKTVDTEEGINMDYDFGQLARKEPTYIGGEISGTGGQRSQKKKTAKKKQTFGTKRMKANFGKSFGANSKSKKKGVKISNPYGEVRQKPKPRAKPKPEPEQDLSFDNPFENRFDRTSSVDKKKQATMKNAEFMMMMSDINDYKQKIANNDDINKFERFLHGDMEPPRDDEYSADEGEHVDMKDAIKYMTREERQEYLNQKKMRRKKKFEDEMKKKNSFKPKINKKSKAIDQNRTKNMKFKRHDLLFGLNTVLKQREEQLKEVIETERFLKYAQEELNECTFHPRINRGGNNTVNEGSIAERTRAFMEKKKMRQEDYNRQKKINEVRNCTFTPQINRGVRGRKF